MAALRALATLVLAALATACGDGATTDPCAGKSGVAGTRQVAIQSGGRERSFYLNVPDSALRGEPVPLVLGYHGVKNNGAAFVVNGRLDRKASEEGFIVAAGNGIRESWNSGFCSNPGGALCVADVDDVGFTRDMIPAIASAYCIDSTRIYATGFSKGAAMVFRLACEASDVIAAFAPAGGGLAIPCASARPRPIQIINNVMDPEVPFALGQASFAAFLTRNVCNEVRQTTQPAASTRCDVAPECAGGATTEFCAVQGVAHHWPGGATDPNGVFAATDAVWRFFAAAARR